MKIKQAKVNGEKSLDYPLQFITGDVLILRDLRIYDKDGYFQIDVLIISRAAILIVEVKNWSGTLLFAENDQVIRVKDRVKEGFQSPILQVKLQKHRLIRWLRENDFAEVPINYFIVISYPSTIIRPASSNCTIPKEVIFSNELFSHVNRLTTNQASILTEKTQYQIATSLKRSHVLPCNDVMKKHNISPGSLIKGVICQECGCLPMQWKRSAWLCRQCKGLSRTAHIQAFAEYKLLISDMATNQELRSFLQIESRHVMRRLLKKQHLEEVGTGKGLKYIL